MAIRKANKAVFLLVTSSLSSFATNWNGLWLALTGSSNRSFTDTFFGRSLGFGVTVSMSFEEVFTYLGKLGSPCFSCICKGTWGSTQLLIELFSSGLFAASWIRALKLISRLLLRPVQARLLRRWRHLQHGRELHRHPGCSASSFSCCLIHVLRPPVSQ